MPIFIGVEGEYEQYALARPLRWTIVEIPYFVAMVLRNWE